MELRQQLHRDIELLPESVLQAFCLIAREHIRLNMQNNNLKHMELIAALEKMPAKEYNLDSDTDGNILIDKDLHPELYDWAVNG